jgi:long-chain acyl-CoA synthetase
MAEAPLTLDAAFLERVRNARSSLALRYFDHEETASGVARVTAELAAAFQDLGIRPGDRVGVSLQNIPGFAYALVALWRIGATPLLLNPMYRGDELVRLVKDAEPVGIVYGDDAGPGLASALSECDVRWFMRTDATDWTLGVDPRVAPSHSDDLTQGHHMMREAIAAQSGREPEPVQVSPGDVAILAYTSGTTGPAKGAMVTHRGVLHVVRAFAATSGHQSGDVVMAIAPMFHITGAVLSAALSLVTDSTLVIAGRFDADVVAEAIKHSRVTSVVASITAYNALLNSQSAHPSNFRTIKAAYSGGAPVPLSTVERIKAELGFDVRNVYGMTESSSAATCVPIHACNRAHADTGSLSIGPPVPGVVAVVADSHGNPLPAGEQGELMLGGPSVMAGYWRNPGATEAAFTQGLLRTGDGAIIDRDGWVYLMDRLKDQINVSGYKVWPREVEDVLYAHDAVHEVAVVGHSDQYQGEAVAAYVVLRPEMTVDSEGLRQFVRERLAAYKVPKRIVIVSELPKTASGKIQRNKLRG